MCSPATSLERHVSSLFLTAVVFAGLDREASPKEREEAAESAYR